MVLDDSALMEWVVGSVKGSIAEFAIAPLSMRENREYCEYIRSICKYAYRLHLFYQLRGDGWICSQSESHRLTNLLCPKFLSLVPLCIERVIDGDCVPLYLDAAESGGTVREELEAVEKVCVDMILSNNGMEIQDLCRSVEVGVRIACHCRVSSSRTFQRCWSS